MLALVHLREIVTYTILKTENFSASAEGHGQHFVKSVVSS